MKYKFYLVSIIGIGVLPTLLTVALLLPYINNGQFSYVFYSLKPFALQVFKDKQTLWSFAGIITAAFGILLGFLYKDFSDRGKFDSLVKALHAEMLRNFDLLFTGEVERPYSFEVFDTFSKKYIDEIKDINKYSDFVRRVYDELYYYREIVKIWRVNEPLIVTEKQFTACNVIVEHFEGKGIDNSDKRLISSTPGNNDWEKFRQLAIDKKQQNIGAWREKLKEDFKEIFGVKI